MDYDAIKGGGDPSSQGNCFLFLNLLGFLEYQCDLPLLCP